MRPPLPEPIAWTSSRNRGKTWITTDSDPTDLMPDDGGIVHSLHTDNQCRAYADACVEDETAALRDRLHMLLSEQSKAATETAALRRRNEAHAQCNGIMAGSPLRYEPECVSLSTKLTLLQIERDDLKSDLIAMQRERDELRENGDRLLDVADSAVAHQQDMIEAVASPLRDTIVRLRDELDAAQADAQRYRSLMGKP
jgi:chromosome segregation ATPase